VSAWIQEQNILGHHPNVDWLNVKQILLVPKPNLIERSRRMLRECARRTKIFDHNVFEPILPLAAITWSENEEEVQSLADLLREEGFLKKGSATEFRLTARGIMEVETARKLVETDQVFVAMAFDRELRHVYDEGLAPGIRASGYQPLRVDRHEHVNRIDDEIIAQIRRSRFLVADFTGQKHGVYFEAGYALGRAMPVIWTCRKTDLAKLHFDIRQYNCIDWDTEKELVQRLSKRIEAVVGRGPHPSLVD
jgi:hypothetical protein